jgi:aryl-alcohol dehydrogenase-like predicted oxidoreductase
MASARGSLALGPGHARGRTGIPPLGFGCGPNAGLMVSPDGATRRRVVGAALDAGIEMFDTAAAYGDGTSERNLGAVLGECGALERTQVFTKVLVAEDDLGDVAAAVVRSSLARTGCRRFAGVTLHNRLATRRSPGQRIGIGPVLTISELLGPGGVAEGFERLRAAGVAGLFGFTTLGGEHAAIEAALASGRFDYVNAIHGLLGPLDRQMPPITGCPEGYDVVAAAARAGLDVVALRVFGGGLLVDPGPEQRGAVEALRAWAEARGQSLTRLALRYALSNPAVAALVIGFTAPEHVTEAVAAVHDGGLDDDEVAEIDRLRARR